MRSKRSRVSNLGNNQYNYWEKSIEDDELGHYTFIINVWIITITFSDDLKGKYTRV